GQAPAGAHEELLADPDVDDTIRVGERRVTDVLPGDLGVHERGVLALVEECGDGPGELLSRAHTYSSTWATTTLGVPAARRVRASRISPWSRPSTRTSSQPFAA